MLKIEYLNINDLNPYEKNARKHQQADVETIKNSIIEFGMCDPIGIWGKSNTIVEGHGRLIALKQLGYEEVPVIRLDHLTDEQRRAYGLAHNKTAEMSDWDFDLLGEELYEETCKDIRIVHGDDSVCGMCIEDCDHGVDGYANECSGFEKDDCFRLNVNKFNDIVFKK